MSPKKLEAQKLVAVTEWFCFSENFASFSLRREVVEEGEMPLPNLHRTQILGCCNIHITAVAMIYKCGYSFPCPIPSTERLHLSHKLPVTVLHFYSQCLFKDQIKSNSGSLWSHQSRNILCQEEKYNM